MLSRRVGKARVGVSDGNMGPTCNAVGRNGSASECHRILGLDH